MLSAAVLMMGFELVSNHGFESVNNKEQNVCLADCLQMYTILHYHLNNNRMLKTQYKLCNTTALDNPFTPRGLTKIKCDHSNESY